MEAHTIDIVLARPLHHRRDRRWLGQTSFAVSTVADDQLTAAIESATLDLILLELVPSHVRP